MGQFDTHGGYFAPEGYLKVNEGGSHEENPNGGVQLGVDEQGIPNMLEEGEPVYNDYVYSDNIKADERMLKKHNIPEKYSGKLYSEIADKFVDEAAERPNDPISNTGLEAMLTRLASAQDEQKERRNKQNIRRELSKLSPEELAQLNSMLGGVEQEQVQEEQPVEQVPVEQPMMADGGYIRKLEDGTPGELNYVTAQIGPEGAGYSVAVDMSKFAGMTQPEAQEFINSLSDSDRQYYIQHGMLPAQEGLGAAGLVGPSGVAKAAATAARSTSAAASAGRLTTSTLGSVGRGIKRAASGVKNKIVNTWPSIHELAGRKQMVAEAKAGVVAAKATKAEAASALEAAAKKLEVAEAKLARAPKSATLQKQAEAARNAFIEADKANLSAGLGVAGAQANRLVKGAGAITTGPLYNRAKFNAGVEAATNAYNKAQEALKVAKAGKKAKEIETATKAVEDAAAALDKAQGFGAKLKAAEWMKAPIAGAAIADAMIGGDDASDDFVKAVEKAYQTSNKKDEGGKLGIFDIDLSYANGGQLQRKFEDGTPGVVAKPEPDKYGFIVGENYLNGVYIGNGEFMPQEELAAAIVNSNRTLGDGTGSTVVPDDFVDPANDDEFLGLQTPSNTNAGKSAGNASSTSSDNGQEIHNYPTFPRYIGGITAAALGLNALAQRPDHYDFTSIRPHTVSGTMPIQLQRYQPVDMNIPLSAIQAQGAATDRAILNAGLGPSIGANLIANNARTNQALGAGFLQAWQANNQHRNEVIAHNNEALARRAQFNMQRDLANMQARNQAQQYNSAMGLRVAALNNQAMQDKYNAIGVNLNNMAEALSGIGQENFAMNQINNNPALMQYLFPGGISMHKGTSKKKTEEGDE